ncbi:BREX system Lon protease-like protein BrxL [Phocaeicola plebeius]|uniref:BREX system Lon protease-like protein BrxL n=1 Tax=Phocaeicola plebeius TaxID=310297 RepID=UPI0029430022|nr:BREX system Lon protease-like protein BrxL [Phocaeicola plebeius]
MQTSTVQKIREQFAPMAIFKDPSSTNSLFAGRNLPSFVKDFILKRYISADGSVNRQGLTDFLDKVIPERQTEVKDRLDAGEELTLLTRFIIYIDLVKGLRRFGIPDLGIKINEGQIPQYVYKNHRGELVDGEKWGIIKITVLPDEDGKKNHVEMVDYKPFKPYKSVDIDYLRNARASFSIQEWIDVLLSAMEYEADGFESTTQKMEFLTRLLIFVEPRLNVIELAPKGTGKSFVFGNLSKYGWLVSGGKVTRAKLFYDKAKQQNGIIKNHDFTAFDEIQTIIFQEPAEIQAALKSYLESGKTTIDNNEFSSECGLMIMGNIPLNEQRRPLSYRYFDSLPQSFRESALLDRFHCFIEGWHLPRINKGIIYKGWTINVEYFSEILHTLRTQNIYGLLFDALVGYDKNADTRDFNAVKRIAVGYMKLLFPHWTSVSDINKDDFDTYCLQPAIRRRGIIKEQCHYIDPEFKTSMPYFWIKEESNISPTASNNMGVEENQLF